MAKLAEIKSNVWGFSVLGSGVVAEGLANLRQCIDIILRTTKGSDPLRPQFGTEIFKFIDKPVTVAIPNIKREIIQALERWERRITVKEVSHEVKKEQVLFQITYVVTDEKLLDKLTLLVNGGDILTDATQSELILQAMFPTGYLTKRVRALFALSGEDVLPLNPAFGFANVEQLYNHVKEVWSTYGRWVLNADRIILYLKPGNYTSASLVIELLSIYKHTVDVSEIDGITNYQLVVTNGESVYTSPPTENFTTAEQLLLWVRSNLGELGEWNLEYSNTGLPGDFSNDYNNDFSNASGLVVRLTLSGSTVTGLGQIAPVLQIQEVE